MAEEAKGTIVTINDKQYALNSLSDLAQKQLTNIRVVDVKLEEAQNQVAILQAARRYYASVLEKELP